MKIVMLGSRGIPASSGGIERHVEELGAELVAQGHNVTVFARSSYAPHSVVMHRGVKVAHSLGIDSKHLEALTYTASATILSIVRGYDVYHFHGVGPAIFSLLPRLFRRGKVVVTVHGLDFARTKWNPFARRIFKIASTVALRFPHQIIVVAPDLQTPLRQIIGRPSVYIPNGVRGPANDVTPGLQHDEIDCERPYILAVGRLVPEKAHDTLIEAYRSMGDGRYRLLIAGGSSHSGAHVEKLEALAQKVPGVHLLGNVHGSDLSRLYSNAAVFVQPSMLEGMPLTLLEAASHGVPIVASDIPVHCHLLGDNGAGHRLFPTGDKRALAIVLTEVLSDLHNQAAAAKVSGNAMARYYNWGSSATKTVAVYSDQSA